MDAPLFTCPSCGTKNRIAKAGRTGRPICGSCRSPFPVDVLRRPTRPANAPITGSPLVWWKGARLLHKWAIGVGAFCVFWCFLVLLLLASGGSSEATSIERVLRQDGRSHENVENVQQVVDNMRRIRLSDCPPDFRQVYISHIHAWEMLAEAEQQAIGVNEHYSSGEALIESIIRGALGDPLGKVAEAISADRQVQQNFAYAQDQVRLTYRDVEIVAAGYGAELLK